MFEPLHLRQIGERGQDTFLNFVFSLTFKAFVMFVTFLLFLINFYVILAFGKGPKRHS